MEWLSHHVDFESNRISRNVYFLDFYVPAVRMGGRWFRGRGQGRVRHDGMREEGKKGGGWMNERKKERNACVWPVYLVGGL